jgi:hypothetical protein
MKAKLFLLMVLSTFLFLGCSTDNQEDSFYDSSNSKLSEDNLVAKVVTRPFKVKGSGTFSFVSFPFTEECGSYLQYLIEGQGNATHLGKFTVTITYCTDFVDYHYLSGTQVAANGDELEFYSVGSGVDEQGQWTDYIYDGGTGRFTDAEGTLRLYGVFEPTDFDFSIDPPLPLAGVYSNHGSGTLTY